MQKMYHTQEVLDLLASMVRDSASQEAARRVIQDLTGASVVRMEGAEDVVLVESGSGDFEVFPWDRLREMDRKQTTTFYLEVETQEPSNRHEVADLVQQKLGDSICKSVEAWDGASEMAEDVRERLEATSTVPTG